MESPLVRRHIVRYIRLGSGSALLVFGAIGGFIPVLQGWVFVVAGLTIMAPESKMAHGLLEWAKRKAGMGAEAQPVEDTETGTDTIETKGS